MLKRHKARYPDDPFPLVSTTSIKQHQQQNTALSQAFFHNTPYVSRLSMARNCHRQSYAAAVEGWGDEITQYYVVEDMLKCHPGQLMHLYQAVNGQLDFSSDGGSCGALGTKGVVENFVASLGDWFENNGETLCETIGFVVGDRGGDVGDLKEGVEDGWEGIARKEDE